MKRQETILVVEAEERARARLGRVLEGRVRIQYASSLSQAARLLETPNAYAVAVMGQGAGVEDHLSILKRVRATSTHTGIILLAGKDREGLSSSLLEKGLVDHVAAPDHPVTLLSAVRNELMKQEIIRKNTYYLRKLEKAQKNHRQDIKRALELEEIYDTTLENLMTALDLRDVETFGHSRTVAKYSDTLARILGIRDKELLDNIRKGALLHDVGKIAIPDAILKKPGALTPEEWEKIRLHPTLGYGLIKEIKLLKEVGHIILYHHERYDGNGYPKGLKKNDIPLEARIFALADALDAITSYRPYRKERDFKAARKEIQTHSKKQFDPEVVEAFCSLSLENWQRIRFETTKLLPAIAEMKKV